MSVFLLCVTLLAVFHSTYAIDRKNVVLITIDDLRTQLNSSNGMIETHTPNLDKLAQEATTFTRAYCQQAVCSPSRNSFMSGRRPDTTKVWNFINHFREADVGQNWTSMPEYFKKQGPRTPLGCHDREPQPQTRPPPRRRQAT